MKKIKTHIKPDGKLDISEEQIEKLAGKDIEIIIHEEKSDFLKTLRNSPKIKIKEDNLTREFLHRVDKDGNLHR